MIETAASATGLALASQLIIVRIPRLVRGTRRRLPSPAPHTPARGIVRSRARSSRARPFGRPFARRGFATDAGSGRGGRGRCCCASRSGRRGSTFRACAGVPSARPRAPARRAGSRARADARATPRRARAVLPRPAPAPRARSPTARTGRFGRSWPFARTAAAPPRARRSARRPRVGPPRDAVAGTTSPRPSRGRPRSSPRSRTSSARRARGASRTAGAAAASGGDGAGPGRRARGDEQGRGDEGGYVPGGHRRSVRPRGRGRGPEPDPRGVRDLCAFRRDGRFGADPSWRICPRGPGPGRRRRVR